MKLNFVAAVSLLIAASAVLGQSKGRRVSTAEEMIRKLDLEAAEAIRKKDGAAIDLIFARDSVTNNPRGGLTVGAEGVKELFRTGVIDYASLIREVESVQMRGNTAIVMGRETVTTNARDGQLSRTYARRYTNVWMRSGKTWQIVARHASPICP